MLWCDILKNGILNIVEYFHALYYAFVGTHLFPKHPVYRWVTLQNCYLFTFTFYTPSQNLSIWKIVSDSLNIGDMIYYKCCGFCQFTTDLGICYVTYACWRVYIMLFSLSDKSSSANDVVLWTEMRLICLGNIKTVYLMTNLKIL